MIGGNKLKSEINVTPLVDVMLVVLIVFMLVTPMFQKGIGVALPQARNVREISEVRENVAIITLTASGELFVGGQVTDLAALERLLRRVHAADPRLELHVKADQDVRFGEVRKVIDAAERAGLSGAALVAGRLQRPGRTTATHGPRSSRP